MQASVEVIEDIECPGQYMLEIRLKGPGWGQSFLVEEPQLTSYAEWTNFINGGYLGLYSGSGGCVSHMTHKDGAVSFASYLSGSGNDTTQMFWCDASVLIPKLCSVIEALHTAGRLN